MKSRFHNYSREHLEAEVEEYIAFEAQFRQDVWMLGTPQKDRMGRLFVPVYMDPKRPERAARRFAMNMEDYAEAILADEDDGKFPSRDELAGKSPPPPPLWAVLWSNNDRHFALTMDGKWMDLETSVTPERLATFSSEERAQNAARQWKGTRVANLRGSS